MFGVIFNGTSLSEKEVAFIGLIANISSAIFSNLGTWISNNTRLKNLKVILLLNAGGFVASLFILASSAFKDSFFQNVALLCITITVLRAGFSSFVSLALLELENYGLSSVIVSSIFFWIANLINLIMIYVTDWLPNLLSLSILPLVVFLCMSIVEFAPNREEKRVREIEFVEEERTVSEVEVFN